MESLSLKSKDGFCISATLFEPERCISRLLVINSATGVKQQVYFSFANYMASFGYTVITYDYRGIGESKPASMRAFRATMRDWGSLDFRAVTEFVQNRFPTFRKYCLGHSVGALILGMNPDSLLFRRFVFIGTQKAFVGNLSLRTAALGYLGFAFLLPLTTALWGYFPAHRFGLGESLPTGTAHDWRTLVIHRKSTNKLLQRNGENFASSLNQGVLVVRAEDDTWLTDKAVRKLMEETYPNMTPTYRLLHTSESANREIGHINFFRNYNRNLWKVVLDYLEQDETLNKLTGFNDDQKN